MFGANLENATRCTYADIVSPQPKADLISTFFPLAISKLVCIEVVSSTDLHTSSVERLAA